VRDVEWGDHVTRKERCIFLFSDLVMITTLSRRGTRTNRDSKKSIVSG
jgi:hypothetical protein